MVLSKTNLSNGYTEMYDIAGLRDIANMAMRDAVDSQCGEYLRVVGKRVPDGSYSDMSCNVWSLMNELILFGMELRNVQNEELDRLSPGERIDRIEDFRFMNPIETDIRMRES